MSDIPHPLTAAQAAWEIDPDRFAKLISAHHKHLMRADVDQMDVITTARNAIHELERHGFRPHRAGETR